MAALLNAVTALHDRLVKCVGIQRRCRRVPLLVHRYLIPFLAVLQAPLQLHGLVLEVFRGNVLNFELDRTLNKNYCLFDITIVLQFVLTVQWIMSR